MLDQYWASTGAEFGVNVNMSILFLDIRENKEKEVFPELRKVINKYDLQVLCMFTGD